MLNIATGSILILVNVALVLGRTFTFRIASGTTECFYGMTIKPNEKLGFYFNVQSGGNFDLDYRITDPLGEEIVYEVLQRDADLVFTGEHQGEYSFCLINNEGASQGDKVVDFDIVVENDFHKASLPIKHPLDTEKQSNMEESMFKINAALMQIERDQRYFKTKEHRNMSLVRSTESRIYWGALVGSGLVILMGISQVWIIRTFFGGSGTLTGGLSSSGKRVGL